MSRLVRVSLICLVSLLVACADDLDFPDNRRTLDITNDNAEEHLWSAYQVFFATLYFSNLDDSLDSVAFGGGSGTTSCAASGTREVSFPRTVGEVYEEGDEFSVEYSDCVGSNSIVYSGLIRGKYTEIEGYNAEFRESVTVDQCIASFEREEEDFDAPTTIDDQSESVAFDKQGDRLFVRYFNAGSDAAGSQVTKSVYELSLDQNAIVVNRSATDASSTLQSDGAALYKVENGEQEKIDCLFYERRAELKVENLTLDTGSVLHRLSGTFEIIEQLTQEGQSNYRLIGDDISVELRFGNVQELYTLDGLEWRQETDLLTNNTYAITYDSELINRIDGSIAESRSQSGTPLRGRVGDATVNDGVLAVRGKDQDSTAMNVNNSSSITFAIDAKGDQDGDGRRDPTADNFDVSWANFLGRQFVRPPEIELEEKAPEPDSSSVTNI